MAAIDFPAAPTNGQLFRAPNGVIYQYDSVRGLWMAVPNPQQFTSTDFFATAPAGQSLGAAGTYAVVVFPTVVTGNVGAYYNTSNGRYTPPAGRYALSSFLSMLTATAAGTGQVTLFKNGVAVPNASASFYIGAQPVTAPFAISAVVDANGTDYFEVRALYQSASASVYLAGFSAIPVGVIVAATGDTWRLLGRQVVTSAQGQIDFTAIPSDINNLWIEFQMIPVVNAAGGILQFFDSSGVIATTSYLHSCIATLNNQATNAAPAVSSSTSTSYTSGILLEYSATSYNINNNALYGGVSGDIWTNNIRDTVGYKSARFSTTHLNDISSAMLNSQGGGQRQVAGAISGVRLLCSNGNIASGRATLWGSP